jgi:hypothetical protein
MYWLYYRDAELGKFQCVDGVVSSAETLLSDDDAFTGIYGDIADAIRDGRDSVSGTTVNDCLPFVLTWNQIDSVPDDNNDGKDDEEDEPSREKYITINDDPDYWGSVEPDFDLDGEIAKLINAADDAGITVYHDCKPSQEVRDNGTEIYWFGEWCGGGHAWDEHRWVNWFRGQ